LDSLPAIHYNRAVVWRAKLDAEGRAAFSGEAMRYLDHLHRVAFHLARDGSESEDLVQETYLRALQSSAQYAPGTNMKAWMTKILYNLFFDGYHERKRWVSTDAGGAETDRRIDDWSTAAESSGPEKDLLARELSVEIAGALKEIPEEFRSPLVLVDMGDCSYAEAAEILSCPVGTVRSRLSRGRRALQQRLERYVASAEKIEK
jgi:RNA polymerase sigma-70 factor (ECF subfamily)